MIKYTIYRIFAAILAIIASIVITFFVMHLIPGHPNPPSGDKNLESKEIWWSKNGFIYDIKTHSFTNSAQQFLWFIKNLDKRFGIYFGSTVEVNTYFDNSMLVTIAYALPAFFLSTIIGVWFGYYAAKYRGKFVDSFINVVAVTVSSIPVFVLGILLFKLAGVIGLSAQFVPFASSESALASYESLILPTVVVTLMGLPSVVFMSRNEFVEIFKSEYIKTARGKGLSSLQIFRKHILRNAFMPIMYATSGNLLLIFGGSIVIQIIFNIQGNATGEGLGQMLADGVTGYQYYFECFSILFFGGVYFLYAIILDWMYVIVDPRVQLRSSSELLIIKVLNSKHKFNDPQKISKKLTENEESNHVSSKVSWQEKKYNRILAKPELKWNSLNYFKNEQYLSKNLNDNNKFNLIDLQEMWIDSDIGVETNKSYSFNAVKLFKPVDSLKKGTDRIGDSNIPTWINSIRTFAKNKIALFFAVIMIFLILFFAIFSYASPYSASEAINSSVSITSLQFLPPRFPGMGIHSIVETHIYNSATSYANALKEGIIDTHKDYYSPYNTLTPYQVIKDGDLTYTIGNWVYNPAGSTLFYTYYYPYAQSGLQDLFPILGTNKYGIDYLTELSYAFSRVVLFTVVVIIGSTIIGLIYGGIQGSFAGSNADIVMQWFTQILLSVPTLIWVIVLGLSFGGGTLTLWNLSWILILITWPGVASITRLYVIKYKDYEFIQAARIIGMPRFKIVMTHLLPNTFGKVTVYALNSFGGIMQWPSFLLFIGLTSSFGISLSNIIFDAYQDSSIHWNLMLSVMMLYVFPYLAFQVIANAVNDSLDSRN